MASVAITGNTYQVKDRLKALGARWDGDKKAWMVSEKRADVIRGLNIAGIVVASAEPKPLATAAPAVGYVSCKTAPAYTGNRCAECGIPCSGKFCSSDCRYSTDWN